MGSSSGVMDKTKPWVNSEANVKATTTPTVTNNLVASPKTVMRTKKHVCLRFVA